MKIKIVKVIFSDLIFRPSDIPKIRGYFADKFPEETELHKHLPGSKFDYKFPCIQYRIINRHPALIAFGRGLEVIKKIFFKSDEIIINNDLYKSFEKEIICSEYELGIAQEFINYRFISPWMALKEENYAKYKVMDGAEKQKFLRHLLRENLKTLSKGFNYTIPDIEQVKVEGFFIEKPVNFKDNKMLCFLGDFTINFYIPEYMGLGKQPSRGFGVVRRIK